MKRLHHLRFFTAPASPAALLGACILLAGCATAPPATVRVDVPVFVPCVAKVPPKPVYEFDRLPAGAMDGEKVLALAKDWLKARAYELQLEAILAGC